MKVTKKLKKVFIPLLSFCLIALGFGFTNIQAKENETYYDINSISESYEELEEYIKVQNNQFVLDLSKGIVLSDELNTKIAHQLETTNTIIRESNYIVDVNTKIARPKNEISSRKYGKNAIYFHWNYVELWMDGGLVNTIAKAGAAGAVVAIAAAFPPLVAFLATNPIVGLTTVAVVTSIVDSVVGYTVNQGVVINYNFLLFHVSSIRLQ